MDKLEQLKTELILLNNEYVKKIEELDEKYKDKEKIDNDEDYVTIISIETTYLTLCAIIERIEQIKNIEN